MNITHAPDIGGGWSRLKSHYLAGLAFAGVAIVAVTAAANVNFKGSSTPPVRAISASSVSYFPSATHERFVTFYVVGSGAERAVAEKNIEEAAMERISAGVDDADLSFSVVQFQAPQDEAAFSADVNATMTADPNFHAQIVDMRGKLGPSDPQTVSQSVLTSVGAGAEHGSTMGAEWCKAQAPDESTRELLQTVGYC